MWPVFQKGMTEHIESLKKLAEGASSGYFSRTTTTTDASVANVSTLFLGTNKYDYIIALDMRTVCDALQLLCISHR
jgi:hypothetical protein